MASNRFMAVVVASEGLLAVAAVIWIWLRNLPVAAGHPAAGFGVGLGAAAVLAIVNHGILRRAPAIGPVRQIRRLYRETLRPLLAETTPIEVAVISVAAGMGEELLFRGAVQVEFGLVAASVLFGLAHIGGRRSIAFGVWAAVMGSGLGGLALATGGLVAPIVTHAAYDAAAIMYIRADKAVDGENPLLAE